MIKMFHFILPVRLTGGRFLVTMALYILLNYSEVFINIFRQTVTMKTLQFVILYSSHQHYNIYKHAIVS